MKTIARPATSTFVPSRAEVDDADIAALAAYFGTNDLEGVQGATGRVVRLKARSSLRCGAHGVELRPDACRTCHFLASGLRSP